MKNPQHLVLTILSAALSLAAAARAPAQTAGSLDSVFNPNVAGNYVLATAVQPGGQIIIGGGFASVNGTARQSIARLNGDGSLDAGFNCNVNSDVTTVAVQPWDGKLLISGFFTIVGGTTRNYIARLQWEGGLDFGFNPDANGRVNSVVVQADRKIVIGGLFTSVGGTTRNRMARLNSDGSLDPGFNPDANGRVNSVVVQPDGKIVIGGDFTSVGGMTHHRIARLNRDGSLDPGFNSDANGAVYTLALQADGKIVIGGDFTSVDGTTHDRIARLNSDGSLDSGFNPTVNDTVYSIALQADGKTIIGGDFTSVGGRTRNRIARLNSDGSLDSRFDPNASSTVVTLENPNANSAVYSVAVQGDGEILLGGSFTTLQPNGSATATTRNHFARLNNDNPSLSLSAFDGTTVQWLRGLAAPEVEQVTFELGGGGYSGYGPSPLGAAVRIPGGWRLSGLSLPPSGVLRALGRTVGGYGNGSSDMIQQLDDFGPVGSVAASFNPVTVTEYNTFVANTAVEPGGKLIIIGNFTTGSDTTRKNLVRVNGDGTIDRGFNPPAGIIGSVAVQADGKIVVGGSVRLNNDGSRDSGFGDSNAKGGADCMALQGDGKILICGTGIYRLNSDGTLDGGFNANVAGGYVESIAVQADGKILIGGRFTSVGGVTHNRIARLNSDGSVDSGFNGSVESEPSPLTGSGNIAVRSMALQPDGKIVVGGSFTSVNGTTRNNLARLNSDGTLDSGFNPNVNNWVLALVLQADGKITFGGEFTSVDGLPRRGVARLFGDGRLEHGLIPDSGTGVNGLMLQADGKIIVFREGRIVRLINDVATQSLSAPDASRVQWLRGATAPEVERVTFEESSNGSTPWTLLGPGTRIAGGWELIGLSLPATGWLRARGHTTGGHHSRSSGLVEQVQSFDLPPQSLNISTRAGIELGDRATIGGFIITGNAPKSVVIRGLGPSLASFNLSDVLLNPQLELKGSDNQRIFLNKNWKDTQRSLIEGTNFEPKDDRESVIVTSLNPGAYTTIVTGENGTTGIGVVEVYDNSPGSFSKLGNMSTRGFVQPGDKVMIGGFTLGANSNSTRIAVRGRGPSLSQFGLNPVLADPTLELRNQNGTIMIVDDDWQSDPVSAANLTANGLGLSDRKEAGIFASLPAGQYTAILAGKDGGIGIGLIEIYNLQ